MLSDEEKKAIETIKHYNNLKAVDLSVYYLEIHIATETLVNLIKKQSKEIEELKEKNRQSKMRIVQLENEITARIEDVNQYYTPNDKIKAKIKEVNENGYWEFLEKRDEEKCKDILQSLLEKE